MVFKLQKNDFEWNILLKLRDLNWASVDISRCAKNWAVILSSKRRENVNMSHITRSNRRWSFIWPNKPISSVLLFTYFAERLAYKVSFL